ncbi:MAG: hypothetical protein A3E07_03710 [Candidatus Wildermuthbacteria bacterium RIFCSPHIGHO2_12_FULL_45_9]|uniref:Uncharacterized protein n=1 Tax=Candidatus Wildermuthbacteria bacterium RIFCSPHIGHO2_02_FULL_45_25 TaxID=1802450 RepID=A0A1G2R0Y6_9BACT|nr:MAG: hypothetical protein A2748_02920 [Candidatus Wildermuthbacteria bacterium RIFCSPHIGHO2_01_FULL_45_20]OHA66490.1 MAG: hypothetical protein A3C04_04095 [Candidatus Wildermuthbacteria bacterium RIFCSPHIGHO2_02_FULL_45_25]OHA71470.1 MAG: hypothetical protein A3E07_03710 [Candidatus Wildermuthbacteria bacterium RIFCSPHIGHO2_12_FULL_45_9]
MKRHRSSSRGFTFIEAIAYIAALSIVVMAVFLFLVWVMQVHAKNIVLRETLENAERAMDLILLEAREAEGLYIPTFTATQLSLVSNRHVPSSETSTYIDLFLCGERICMKKEFEYPIALTSDDIRITNLEFRVVATDANIPSLYVTVTAEYDGPAGKPEFEAEVTLTSAVSFRE